MLTIGFDDAERNVDHVFKYVNVQNNTKQTKNRTDFWR